VKFFYATQSGTRPPTFTIFVNTPAGIADSYKKYLIHQFQQQLGFEQTPIRAPAASPSRESAPSSNPRRARSHRPPKKFFVRGKRAGKSATSRRREGLRGRRRGAAG